jgi:hypothetical protein
MHDIAVSYYATDFMMLQMMSYTISYDKSSPTEIIASLGSIENLDAAAVDIVSDMARACSFVNPAHLYCDVSEMFTCPGASEACIKVIRGYYSGKARDNGVNLIAEASLELDNFRKFRGWFGEEVTRSLAAKANPSQFWSVALGHGEAKALAPLAMKMTSSFSGQGAVE